MNTSITIIPHFGAYGIIIQQELMLLVCKSSGPYKGLLDLPGGKIARFESTQKALKREIKEETGLTIKQWYMIGYYECSVPIDETREMHHRSMIYDIQKFTRLRLSGPLRRRQAIYAKATTARGYGAQAGSATADAKAMAVKSYDGQAGKLHDESSVRWHNPLELKESQLTPFAWQAVQHYLKANFHNREHKRLSNNSACSDDT